MNDVTILNLKGSILQNDSQSLREFLEKNLLEKKYNVVVNLLDTIHICSSALGQIVYMKPKFISNGGDIKMTVDDEDLLELLEITMLDQVFNLFSDLPACIHSFHKRS